MIGLMTVRPSAKVARALAARARKRCAESLFFH